MEACGTDAGAELKDAVKFQRISISQSIALPAEAFTALRARSSAKMGISGGLVQAQDDAYVARVWRQSGGVIPKSNHDLTRSLLCRLNICLHISVPTVPHRELSFSELDLPN